MTLAACLGLLVFLCAARAGHAHAPVPGHRVPGRDTPKHSPRYLLAADLNRALAHTSFRGLGFALEREGRRWNVNPYLVAAIAGTESTFGAAACGANPFGWGSCRGVYFASFRDAISVVTRSLRRDYMNRWGKRTVEAIGDTYCACGPSWAQHTRWFMGWLGSPTLDVTYP